jgi:hypothetical protein
MDAWITAIGHALPQADNVAWLQRRLAPDADPERLRRFSAQAGADFRHAAIDQFGAEGEAIYQVGRSHADSLERSRAFVRLASPLAAAAAHQPISTEPSHVI